MAGKSKLPADVLEAFAADSTRPLGLKPKDLAHFEGCVDRSGSSWQVPAPSARFLQLVRRLEVVEDPKVPRIRALVDLSQLPGAWSKPIDGISVPIVEHLRHLLQDALERSKVKIKSFKAVGGYTEFFLAPASVARATEVAAAHGAFIGDGPAFLGTLDAKWKPYADGSMRAFVEGGAATPAKPAAKKPSPAGTKPKATKAKANAGDHTRTVDAVETLRTTREQAVKAMALPNPKDPKLPYPLTAPSSPASPARIAAAEQKLGVKFPASYTHFLSLHDGWPAFDLSSHLLGVDALVELNTSRAQKILKPILGELERKSTEGLLIFGARGSKFLAIFDTTKTGESGEWPVLAYDDKEGLLDEVDDFVAFLLDTADTIGMMARLQKRK